MGMKTYEKIIYSIIFIISIIGFSVLSGAIAHNIGYNRGRSSVQQQAAENTVKYEQFIRNGITEAIEYTDRTESTIAEFEQSMGRATNRVESIGEIIKRLEDNQLIIEKFTKQLYTENSRLKQHLSELYDSTGK